MKKLVLSAGIALLSLPMLMSCGSSSNTAKGDVEVVVPCSGPEYMTNNEYIRASAMGLSTDMNVAKKKAMTSARAEIASSIQTTVKNVTDNYVTSYQMGENDDTKQKFQDMTRQVVNQKLSGLRMICNKVMKTPDGRYKVYITLELAGSELVESVAAAVKADDKMRVDFEYEKFKQIFEEEMNKMQ